MPLSPVVIFAYNRAAHLKRCLDSLVLNPLAKESEVYIYSDGPKNEEEVPKIIALREMIVAFNDSFKDLKVIERKINLGLAPSVITGVTEILEKYDRVIVLEDDLVVSPVFLNFMNQGLEFYKSEERIYAITGWNFPIEIPEDYSHSIYICPRPASWSWATWKRAWQKADWEVSDFDNFKKDKLRQQQFNLVGEDVTPMLKKQQKGLINSWAIRWTYTLFKQKAYCIYPVQSLVLNIGTDGSGTHIRSTKKFEVEVATDFDFHFVKNIEEDGRILGNFRHFFRLSWVRKWINYFLLDLF